MISIERLREVLEYDGLTGQFIWRARTARSVCIGEFAGSVDKRGYLSIQIDGRAYLSHRLAWFYTYGDWPKNQIDHIDGNKSNNRIANLRDVSRSINTQNQRRAMGNNKLGVLGVIQMHRRFRSQIVIGGKSVYLGQFPTPELAHAAYLKAKRLHHEGCTL